MAILYQIEFFCLLLCHPRVATFTQSSGKFNHNANQMKLIKQLEWKLNYCRIFLEESREVKEI